MTDLFSYYFAGSINYFSVLGYPIKEKNYRQRHYCENSEEWNHFMDFDYFVIFCHQFQCGWAHFEAQRLLLQLAKCFDFLFNLAAISSYFFTDLLPKNCWFFLLLCRLIKAFFSCNFVRILIALIHHSIISLYREES